MTTLKCVTDKRRQTENLLKEEYNQEMWTNWNPNYDLKKNRWPINNVDPFDIWSDDNIYSY